MFKRNGTVIFDKLGMEIRKERDPFDEGFRLRIDVFEQYRVWEDGSTSTSTAFWKEEQTADLVQEAGLNVEWDENKVYAVPKENGYFKGRADISRAVEKLQQALKKANAEVVSERYYSRLWA